MDKETLSNYGWIVICVLVLSVMIALATPFGDYVADGFKAAYKGFGDTNTEVTDMMYSAVGTKVPASCGIEGHYKGDNRGTHGIPATDCDQGHKYTCECVSFVVPEGGTYTMKTAVNGKSVYTAGEALPKHYEAKEYDIYEDGDYKYNCYKVWYLSGNRQYFYWNVKTIDKSKAKYGEIFSKIAGKQVINMNSTFSDCTALATAPAIPDSVTDMSITFLNCKSLTTAPAIPNSVTNMDHTFAGCTSLTTAPTIPNSVTNMSDTFWGCTSLTTAPAIPNSVTDMSSTFQGCTSLTTAPTIPNSVTNMSHTFENCKSLTTAPAIPDSVTDMRYTFLKCTALTGTIEINANPTDFYNCFFNTEKPVTLTGTSAKLSELAATANNGNVTVQ